MIDYLGGLVGSAFGFWNSLVGPVDFPELQVEPSRSVKDGMEARKWVVAETRRRRPRHRHGIRAR